MRPRLTGLWRHHDFLKLWAGQSVSLLGSQVTTLALPLTAALVLGATPAQMGVLTALGTLPFLLVGLFAGVWVDRLRRRPILIAADLGRALVLGTIPLAYALDRLEIEQLYAVNLLVGVLTVFFDVAYQAYLPALVERHELVDGNSKLEMSGSIARVAGPGLGGALVQLITAPAAIVLDAVSFLVSALFVGIIRRSEPMPGARDERRGIWAEIGEGLRAVLRHRLLRPIMASTAVVNLCNGIVASVFVLFLTRTLALEPSVIGLSYALGSLGAVGAAVVSTRVARRLGPGRAILAGTALVALSALLLPLAGGPLVTVLAVLVTFRVLGSGGTVIANINQVSLRQAITPAQLQGRVNATNRFVTWAMLPLGALLGGLLGGGIGIRPTLVLGGLGMSFSIVVLLLSPVPSVRQAPSVEESHELISV